MLQLQMINEKLEEKDEEQVLKLVQAKIVLRCLFHAEDPMTPNCIDECRASEMCKRVKLALRKQTRKWPEEASY